MPHHSQFKKTLRKNEKARLRNQSAKSQVNTLIKKVKNATSKEEAEQALRKVVSAIDSTARKGIIKKTTAARKKSNLYKNVANMV